MLVSCVLLNEFLDLLLDVGSGVVVAKLRLLQCGPDTGFYPLRVPFDLDDLRTSKTQSFPLN